MGRKKSENRQGGVGLDRVADQVRTPGKSLLEERETLENLVGAVHVERSSEFSGEGRKGVCSAAQHIPRRGVRKRA